MDAKQVKALAKELKKWANQLEQFKEQLFARHKDDPMKSPPAFLLNTTVIQMSWKANELLESVQ